MGRPVPPTVPRGEITLFVTAAPKLILDYFFRPVGIAVEAYNSLLFFVLIIAVIILS